MKKQLALTTAMAATLSTLSACSGGNDWDDGVVADRNTAVCVDQDGKRVRDENCPGRSHYGGGSHFWYYVNRGGRLPYYGDPVNDPRYGFKGSYFATKGAQYASAPASANMIRSKPISRGGFGSSGRFFGSGHS
ncbi:hypothetical protein OVA07_10380 [Novosphingobium sp. SL115]|uniref:hypothetical protein n=1 Tax=Novosphingobium sp. SL115 TaxID=2995150 RepID=UPI002273B276|nr:hypothetical protein [Novosphingobium sp. SL115]MCY1671415.1 hypothetical protein [Novosphingobium sp. SL115]